MENKIGLLLWKTSNFWQSKLRKILSKYNLSLNEYLILESLNILDEDISKFNINQRQIADFVGINISVVSVNLKLLQMKGFINRTIQIDNRKKDIKILNSGKNLFLTVYPQIIEEEKMIFEKLNNETFNFTNSLKLLLGKKIRIKAKKESL